MNHDKLREVAAAIELEPEAFRMSQWMEDGPKTLCGTIGCIAGTTVRLDSGWMDRNVDRDDHGRLYVDHEDISRDAAEMLGLQVPEDESDHPLFINSVWWAEACQHLGLSVPEDYWPRLGWITPKHAATVLYALADETIHFEDFDYVLPKYDPRTVLDYLRRADTTQP
jgi:hypothetical protein